MIRGHIIDLVPAALDDRKKVYEWCFQSETTKSHSGPPDYPDVFIPSFEEFCCDDYYAPYFFDGSAPDAGAGFIITHKGEPVGFISYSSFHVKQYMTELDIWLNCEANCGKGFGSDAIMSLADYLGSSMGIREFIIRPSVKNARAICAYKKAGFEDSDASPTDYLRDEYISLYGDGDYGAGKTALLIKRLSR